MTISADAVAVVGGATGLAGGGATVDQVNTAITAALAALTIPDEIADLDDFSGTPATGDLLRWNGTDWAPYTPVAITWPTSLNYNIDGGGSVIATGNKRGFRVNNAGTITGWTLGGDPLGSITVQVWKDTYSNFPPTVADLILTMTISSTTKNTTTGLSIAYSAGDYFYFNVSSVTTMEFCMVQLMTDIEVGP